MSTPTAEEALRLLIESAMSRALAQGKAFYVFATAAQWVIGDRPPPFHNRHMRCEPSPPRVVRVEWDDVAQQASETVVWASQEG